MRVIRILLALMLLAPLASKASHIIGGDIQYKYVGDSTGVPNQYRVKLVLYREATGIGLGTSQTVSIVSTSCNLTTSVTVNLAVPEFSAASLGAYDCIPQSAATFSPMVNIYVGYVTLPTLCPDYKMYWASCCRPAGITGITGSAGVGFYFEAELNNTITTGPKNSSPTFVSTPLSYICTGGFINYLQNAFEINGDSIQYELIPAREDWPLASPVPYAAGYSFTDPIHTTTTNPFTLNPQSGNITFVANTVETSVIALRVNEYRFDSTYYVWVKVGSSNREIQVSVAGNCNAIVNAGVALDPTAPGVSIDALGRQTKDYDCLDSSVTLLFTLDVECASVSPDGSDFRLTNPAGQPIPIKALVPNCDVNGETSTLEVKLFKPLSMNGEYYLYSKVGNDGNTLLNKCGKDMNEFDTIILKVNNCINLDMQLRNVSIDEDEHPHLYWQIDPATFPSYLFNLYRVYRSADGGASYQPIASLNDSAAREFVDISVAAAKVDAQSYRYYVQMILNQQQMPPTNVVHSMWLRGNLTTASSVPVVWNEYNGWNNPQYQIQWGTSIGPNLWLWENYGTPNGDTTTTVVHPNLGPGLYAVRIRTVRNMSQVSAEDTAWSNWIQVGEPVPPIPPIDSLTVPNVFTPNGDGRNDGFTIRGLMSYQTDRIVKIFDRTGLLVYENYNYDNNDPWKGEDRQGQPLPAGVYFYIVEAFDAANNTPPAYAGRRRQWKGNVTLLQK